MNLKKAAILVAVVVVIILLFRQCGGFGSSGEVDPAIVEDVTASRLDSIASQKILLNIKQEAFVIGEGGTVLIIKENAFLDASGNPVNENVELELKEVQTIDDFVKSRISTMSNGKLLSTAGSYFLNASSDGQPLSVNPEVGLNVSFPVLKKDPDMKLFRGEITEDGDVNWIATDKKEEPMPKPIIAEPEALKGFKVYNDVLEAKRFLEMIDAGYSKEGNSWVPKYGSEMTYDASFVSKVRRWYKHNQYKAKVFEERRNKYIEAWNKYLIYQNKKIEEIGERNAYEYKLDKMGWFNCDKFRGEKLIPFTGIIVDSENESVSWVRVHLLSRSEQVHVSIVAKEGGKYSFQFPQGIPFEIYASRKELEGLQTYDGSTQDLGEVVLGSATNKNIRQP